MDNIEKTLATKIDFVLYIGVKNANPNGDPLNGNRPRQTYSGLGEISDVCLKRKIRNRLDDFNEKIFVKSEKDENGKAISLSERYKKFKKENNYDEKKDDIEKLVCREWIDVRSFGQVFAFEGEDSGSGVSIGIRGPVSIQSAFSQNHISISTMQITKSVSSKSGSRSDTMGQKHRVDDAEYITCGSINTQLASKTGFTDKDAEIIKHALATLFENDESSARPSGSMKILKLIWVKHNCPNGNFSSAKVHEAIKSGRFDEINAVEERSTEVIKEYTIKNK